MIEGEAESLIGVKVKERIMIDRTRYITTLRTANNIEYRMKIRYEPNDTDAVLPLGEKAISFKGNSAIEIQSEKATVTFNTELPTNKDVSLDAASREVAERREMVVRRIQRTSKPPIILESSLSSDWITASLLLIGEI